MKTKLICWLFILMGVSVMQAQLTDHPSRIGSFGAFILYKQLENEDKKNRDKIEAFRFDYIKRQAYFLGLSKAITNRISNEINASFVRYNQLETRNSSLSILSYSRKKENTKMLSFIEKMLTTMQREANTQQSVLVIYGERMNLLQNMMESLIEIHRVLDVVEDNIEQTTLYNRIFN